MLSRLILFALGLWIIFDKATPQTRQTHMSTTFTNITFPECATMLSYCFFDMTIQSIRSRHIPLYINEDSVRCLLVWPLQSVFSQTFFASRQPAYWQNRFRPEIGKIAPEIHPKIGPAKKIGQSRGSWRSASQLCNSQSEGCESQKNQ